MEHLFDKFNWSPPEEWKQIQCIDMHTGGEPLRIPVKGLPMIQGNTVLEKRSYFMEQYDHLRKRLMFEPRGHADMYGAILSKPSTSDADFDVFFIHNEGYSTMCGHAIIALTKFVFETGLLHDRADNTVTFNVPAGQIHAQAQIKGNEVVLSSFKNVPSYLYLADQVIKVPELGDVPFDIAFGGAYYAIVKAESLGLGLKPKYHNRLIDIGRKIKNEIIKQYDIKHPAEADLSFLYGTIFTGAPANAHHHSRNVCIFAEGELDRSATGSGVSARAALHYEKGHLPMHMPITIESILGSTMTVEVIERVDFHGYRAIVPEVTGSAHFVGQNSYSFDPSDPFLDGFIFR